jgi:hypothetical protein
VDRCFGYAKLRIPKGPNSLLRTVTLAIVLTFALAGEVLSQGSVDKFRFRPNKITVGTTYHYLKTNIDGTHPEYVSQFVAAKDRLEVFKFHPQGERAGLVVAVMDWGIFSAKRLESWQVFADGRKLFATLNYLESERLVEVAIPAMRKTAEKTLIRSLPFHIYNFDFGSLNFAFRHLVNPEGSFVIGVADPTFKNQGPLFTYRGEVTVDYAGEETRAVIRCRKYRINGEGLENRGGYIWVNKDQGHIEDMEIDLPDNPEWKTFKFKLLRTEQMTRKDWEAFMKKQF